MNGGLKNDSSNCMITHIHYFLKIFLLLLFHNSSCLNNLRHFYPSNAQRSQIDDDMSKYIFCHGDLQRLYLDSHSDIRIDKGGLQNTSYVQGTRGDIIIKQVLFLPQFQEGGNSVKTYSITKQKNVYNHNSYLLTLMKLQFLDDNNQKAKVLEKSHSAIAQCVYVYLVKHYCCFSRVFLKKKLSSGFMKKNYLFHSE